MPSYPFAGDLIDSLRSGSANLFVGSGISVAAGMIAWDDLIREMKETILRENTTHSKGELQAYLASANHLDIADLFRSTVQVHRYFQFLRGHFRVALNLSAAHHALSTLPVRTIFTTNYDKLLEQMLRWRQGVEPSVIIYPEQLGYIDDGEIRIIKLHGDIDHPSTIVLTQTDYAAYAQRHRGFEIELHRNINNRTLLLVGFGLRDHNFDRIWNDARQLYDSVKRQAYAIMTGTNAVMRDVWERRGLRIIPVSTHAHLPSCIRALSRAL